MRLNVTLPESTKLKAMPVTSYNTVGIDLVALQHNYKVIKQAVGSQVRVLSMVKSEAYGHGLVRAAQALAEVGADAFGVAEIDEGITLRKAGIAGDVIIFLGSYYYDEIITYNLTPVVFDIGSVNALSECAVRRGVQVGVQLKVDAGMGRLGVMPDKALETVQKINEMPGVFLAGILSHFPMADQGDVRPTLEQNELFAELTQKLGLKCPLPAADSTLVHIANSAALIRFPDTCHNMVRPGIALYGCNPVGDTIEAACLALEPVMSFHSKVVQVKDVPAGRGLSYGHLFVTERLTRLAVLPVGYADGYLRSLTGRAEVLIKGRRAPVRGRICMNACVVDVTDIPGVEVFEDVVLMGSQGDECISADQIATWMETIHYEVVCLFGNNNQRVYCQ